MPFKTWTVNLRGHGKKPAILKATKKKKKNQKYDVKLEQGRYNIN